MSTSLAPGFHAPRGRVVDILAYDRYVGRWSRLFVPELIAAVGLEPGHRVLDVSTGTGEAALHALPLVRASGIVIGADIAPAMLECARERLNSPLFMPVAADGQILPFHDGCFDAVLCQLGLQFFPDPGQGLREFRRVLRFGANAAVSTISTPDRAPMWGILAQSIGRRLPEQRHVLNSLIYACGPGSIAFPLHRCGLSKRRGRAGTATGFNCKLRGVLGADRGGDWIYSTDVRFLE
jgi:SAM-dependent methyltransferase